jgi:hypothetical protein
MTLNSVERKKRILQLMKEQDQLNEKQFELRKELDKLQKEEFLSEHTCPCVKLNSKLGIFDIHEQASLGRVPLELGAVSDTHSANKDCPTCKGTGKPK